MDFLEYTKELNKIAINLQETNEEITEEDIIKAIAYINNIYIDDTGDCLIFLSALNLCNAYVKQNNSKITYSFKKGIEYIIDILNYRRLKNIYINRSSNLFIFQIGHIQFSFHDEKKVEINKEYLCDISWDGIKKQKCAKSIFNSAINNKICVTNKTLRGKNLKEKITKIIEDYQLEKTNIKDLMSIKL